MDNRKEEIMEAFVGLVTRYGFDKTTMQDVAREVGVSVGTIYNTFANKEALIDACHERMFDEFAGFAREVMAAPLDAEQRLHDLLLGFVKGSNRIMRQNRAFLEIMMNNGVIFKYIGKKMFSTRLDIKNNLNSMVEKILEQGVAEGVFMVTSISGTADVIVDSLTEYWATPMVADIPVEVTLEKTENMIAFILCALKKSA